MDPGLWRRNFLGKSENRTGFELLDELMIVCLVELENEPMFFPHLLAC